MKSILKRLIAQTKGKKVVHYTSPLRIAIGASAIVKPVDHPSPLVSNSTHVFTSRVLAYDSQSGIFITENTIYVPA